MAITDKQKKFIIFHKVRKHNEWHMCNCHKVYWVNMLNEISDKTEVVDLVNSINNGGKISYPLLSTMLDALDSTELGNLYDCIVLI